MQKLNIEFDEEHKYTLDEIKLGMRVRATQLDNIYDTYVILYNLKDVFDKIGCFTWEGEILEITNEPTKNDYTHLDDVVVFFNDSLFKPITTI